MRVAAAPVSWGVFEADDPVAPEAFLDDVVVTGYAGTELGPPGYLGVGRRLCKRLDQRGLALVGAFLPLAFSKAELRTDNRRECEGLLDLLEAGAPEEAPMVLLSDAYHDPARIAAAGRVEQTPEVWLSDESWKILLDQVNATASLCRDRGFRVAFHPHGGSFVETPAEVDRLLEGIDRGLLGLCLDTGHCLFGGDDPMRLLSTLGDALAWVHLKDVDLTVLRELRERGFGIEEAWRRGVFCPLGTGGVDIDAVLEALVQCGYTDWIVVEQDRVLGTSGTDQDAMRTDAELNRDFLRKRGL